MHKNTAVVFYKKNTLRRGNQYLIRGGVYTCKTFRIVRTKLTLAPLALMYFYYSQSHQAEA